MYSLFVKFFNESLQLVHYLFNYYLSNIVIISSLQFFSFLLFIKIYNFLNSFLSSYKSETPLLKQKINFVKDILIIYHTKQIKLITEILNNNLVVDFLNDKPHFVNNTKNINFLLPALPDSPISIPDNQTINDETINDETINDETINDETINNETINNKTIDDETINDS
jgi:hypothetical protein